MLRFSGYNLRVFLVLLCFILISGAGWGQQTSSPEIPANPRDLKYPELKYDPPKVGRYRHVLSNGVVVFLAEDHDFPLVNVSVFVRTGSYLDPKGKEGLANMVGSQMRAGGTTTMTAEQFDEEAAFLAAEISSGIGDTQGSANLSCLSKDLGRGLELFFNMLKTPGFQANRIALYKNQVIQGMERRNDESSSIQAREWARLMRGDSHFSTAWSTKNSVESISREDLMAFHQKYYHSGNFIFAVSGDFSTGEMLAKLEKVLQGWPATGEKVPPVPGPQFTPAPGIYVVNKADVNQGRVTLGHLGSMRNNPDYYALTIMNDILGGSGFVSRLMTRVRSDEGLAYSVGSDFGLGIYYDGIFQASFQSKSATVAQATAIVLDEIKKMRTQKVTSGELERAINYRVEVFPRIFATAAAISGTFANDEYTGRPAGFWDSYRARIRAITAEDVLRVAQKYLHPDRLVFLAVGSVDDILKGNPDKPEFALNKFSENGAIKRIPLPDPLTMAYPKE
ncbi:MAG TPA: pitrilysin family protein [Terriglobia bacterium]|nr:pitrilysin family protein [Terriglobia bacterium]